jgi:hypothetical protein
MRMLILILLLAACGKPAPSIPAETAEYVRSYLNAYGGNESDVSITFSTSLPGNVAGMCEGGAIVLNQTFWNSVETVPLYRQWVVWHELGHCVGGLQHTSETKGNCPVSVMSPSVPSVYSCVEALFK